jgi:hypothetical protein
MTESTARLSLPLLMPAQAQKHVTHNEALQLLDALTQLVISGFGLNQPPVSPTDGSCYGVGTAPVGDWAGQAGKIARRSGAGWQFITPQEGWAAWDTVDQASKVYQAGQWVSGGTVTQNLSGIGIQTTSDATNRLAVSSDASLFTHDGTGHQLKINKALAGDTASILFQTGWTGHAEFGLSGNNSFSVKVSADGAVWQTALTADPATGTLALGLPVTGAAVQSGPADATAGKILATGAFGWGTAAAPIASGNIDSIPASGVYLIDAATLAGSANLPAISLAAGDHLVQFQSDTEAQSQIAISQGAGRLATRTRNGAGWNSWREIVTQGSLLGTVSQAAGVPTGAVIERGSNATGSYVRFADGTQICTTANAGTAACSTANGSVFSSSAGTWTFPMAFAGSAAEISLSGSVSTADRWVCVGATSTSAASWKQRAAATSSTQLETRLMAVGRWF